MIRTLQRIAGQRFWGWLLPFQLILIMCAIGVAAGVAVAMFILLLRGGIAPAPLPADLAVAVAPARPPRIARVFTPEVQFWGPQILRWAEQYSVDRDILATVIQIESCGHYRIDSPAGAKGLFQVMPFHFSDDEQDKMTDPEVNAKRGIAYLKESLRRADGHIGLAMAGYNGGWGVIPRGWGRWVSETRNYYVWGSQIYMDALKDKLTEESAALQDWLNSGGSRLCNMAAQILPTSSAAPGQPTVQPLPTTPQPPAPIQPFQAPTTMQPATATPTLTIPTMRPTIFIPPTVTPGSRPITIPPSITPSR